MRNNSITLILITYFGYYKAKQIKSIRWKVMESKLKGNER